MKKIVLVVVLALVLTFAFAASAYATTGKFYAGGVDYYKWSKTTTETWQAENGTTTPAGVTAFINDGVSTIGSNTVLPGVHANYLATTAKCGVCHSVHRANAAGTKLMRTADASCAGCHTNGATITMRRVTWTPASITWVPEIVPDNPAYVGGVSGAAWQAAWHDYQEAPDDIAKAAAKPAWDAAWAAVTNKQTSGGAWARDHTWNGLWNSAGNLASAGGPHNDSLVDMVGDGLWDGTGASPAPDYEGFRYGCFTRRCHSTNPHGADSSKYALFAAKLLFNSVDATGTYGGDDAVWDGIGPTDAAVERFAANNASIITLGAGTSNVPIYLNSVVVTSGANAHALVAGLTCGRPSNPHGGEDECHAEASYAIVDKGIKENRNKGTGLSGTSWRTDNTQAELPGFGGNDSRTSKTGHVAGTFAAVPDEGSYAPIAGCTSCHDQTDTGNNVAGGFTFPHGQTPTGATNLYMADGSTGTGHRARIWSGWSGAVGATLTVTYSAPAGQKAYDGQCLKCHRDGAGNGIGLTK